MVQPLRGGLREEPASKVASLLEAGGGEVRERASADEPIATMTATTERMRRMDPPGSNQKLACGTQFGKECRKGNGLAEKSTRRQKWPGLGQGRYKNALV